MHLAVANSIDSRLIEHIETFELLPLRNMNVCLTFEVLRPLVAKFMQNTALLCSFLACRHNMFLKIKSSEMSVNLTICFSTRG